MDLNKYYQEPQVLCLVLSFMNELHFSFSEDARLITLRYEFRNKKRGRRAITTTIVTKELMDNIQDKNTSMYYSHLIWHIYNTIKSDEELCSSYPFSHYNENELKGIVERTIDFMIDRI